MTVRVAVAMSGGVDSAVACHLLMRKGYDVIGLTMDIFGALPGSILSVPPGQISSTAQEARDVCDHLGVPHRVINMARAFEQEVIIPFLDNYVAGRTPNPCVVCNRAMKFGHLLEKARELGAQYIATGHYARAVRRGREGGRPEPEWVDTFKDPARLGPTYLFRGLDRSKDQSYALHSLKRDMLASSMFPLGNLTKQEVREIAKKASLPVSGRPDSQEICFIDDLGYKEFLNLRGVSSEPGPILDTSGRVLGEHLGLPFYTVGQRRGLGVRSDFPMYVVALDVGKNTLVVGSRDEAHSWGCEIAELNLIGAESLDGPVEGTCMVRYRGKETAAVMGPGRTPGSAEIDFLSPQFAVTPGQALVFYRDDLVFGGGIIVGSTPKNKS